MYIYLYLGATVAFVKVAMFRGTEVEGFAKYLILKIKFRHWIDGYSYVP
jgi:hypothetical protein